jgi:hypothetical protein
MTKNSIDINEVIQEPYIVPESVFDRKRTKTSHFMLNTVFPSGSSIATTEYFVNAFLDDGGFKHKNLQRPLFILFKTTLNDNKWTTICQRLRAKDEYVLEYFCGIHEGKHLIMMIFQIPEKFTVEYEHFKAGRYSKFSDDYKRLFQQFISNEKAQPVESVVWRVMHKSKELRKELETYFTITPKNAYRFEEDDELWGLPEPLYEVYRYNQNIEKEDE